MMSMIAPGQKITLPKPLLKINCHNRTRRIILRVCGITFPLWGLISVYYLAIGGRYENYDHFDAIMRLLATTSGIVIGPIVTFTLLRANLTSDGKCLSFPGLRMYKKKLDDLKRVVVGDDRFEFF